MTEKKSESRNENRTCEIPFHDFMNKVASQDIFRMRYAGRTLAEPEFEDDYLVVTEAGGVALMVNCPDDGRFWITPSLPPYAYHMSIRWSEFKGLAARIEEALDRACIHLTPLNAFVAAAIATARAADGVDPHEPFNVRRFHEAVVSVAPFVGAAPDGTTWTYDANGDRVFDYIHARMSDTSDSSEDENSR